MCRQSLDDKTQSNRNCIISDYFVLSPRTKHGPEDQKDVLKQFVVFLTWAQQTQEDKRGARTLSTSFQGINFIWRLMI